MPCNLNLNFVRLILPRVAHVDGSAQVECRNGRPIDPSHEGEIFGQGLGALLPAAPQARIREALRVEPVERVHAVGEGVLQEAAEDPETIFAPGRGNDAPFGFRPEVPVVEGRLVDLVEEAHGGKQQPDARVGLRLPHFAHTIKRGQTERTFQICQASFKTDTVYFGTDDGMNHHKNPPHLK